MKDKKEDMFVVWNSCLLWFPLVGEMFFMQMWQWHLPFLSTEQQEQQQQKQKTISCAKWMKRCLVFSGHQVS